MTKKAKSTDRMAPAMAVGEQLLAGFKEELTTLKNPGNAKQNIWGTLSEIQQDEVLDRFSKRIKHHFRRAFDAILEADVPAVHCTLASVSFGAKGIKGSLEISAGSAHRHELADFSGKRVLVILTDDLDEYLESMGMVKADKDQGELGLDGAGPAGSKNKGKFTTMTMGQLKAMACDLAEQIEEPDAVEEVESWGREHLMDYIEFAEDKIAQANGGDEKKQDKA